MTAAVAATAATAAVAAGAGLRALMTRARWVEVGRIAFTGLMALRY